MRYADSRENREILLNMLKVEKEIFTKIRLAVLLDFRNAGEIIKEGLQDGDYFIRATALDAIADLKLYEFSDEAIKYLTDESFYVKLCAIETLERLKYKKPSKQIERMIEDKNYRVCMQAAKYCLKMRAIPKYFPLI